MADEYIVTSDKTESYLKYYKNIKKKETAYAAASRLFEKPAMKAYIEERMKALDEEMIAEQREVLRFLSAVMRGKTKEAVLIGQGNGRQSIGDMEVSMKDRIRAGDLLGKRYGLWTKWPAVSPLPSSRMCRWMIEKRLSMVKALGAGYNRFYHNRQFYRVVKGSRGSKKSETAALCYIHDLLKYSWANLLVVRKFSNTSSVTFCEFCLEIVYVLHFSIFIPF